MLAAQALNLVQTYASRRSRWYLPHHFVKLSEATRERSIGELMAGSGALFGHADAVLRHHHPEHRRRRDPFPRSRCRAALQLQQTDVAWD
jgi:hypothetical protein